MRRGIRYPQWWMLLVAILAILSKQGWLMGMERSAKRHGKTLNVLLGTQIAMALRLSTCRRQHQFRAPAGTSARCARSWWRRARAVPSRAGRGAELRRICLLQLFPRHQCGEEHPSILWVQRATKGHVELLN
jgi:hypothetical protein